jgi:hypothetical protein
MRDFYRAISDFKKSYQPRTNIVKYEKVDIFTNFHSILARGSNNFSSLLIVHGVNGVTQTEIYAEEPLVPEPSVLRLRWLLKG